MSGAERLYLGAYALCRKPGRILLARLSPGGDSPGCWTLPGGGVDFGEHPRDAVMRELAEETGLAGTITGLAGVYSQLYERSFWPPHHPVQHVGIVFEVETSEGDLRIEENGTTDLCRWVGVEEIAQLKLVPLARYGVELGSQPA